MIFCIKDVENKFDKMVQYTKDIGNIIVHLEEED